MERRPRVCFVVAVAVLCVGMIPREATANSVAAVPKCPYPCGDNVDLFCQKTHVLARQHVFGEMPAAGLGAEDGWDIRVYQIDHDPTGKLQTPTFKVMIMDDENYDIWVENHQDEKVEKCTEEKVLNKHTSCFSLQTTKCKQHKLSVKDSKQKILVNYTRVVIECEDLGDCMLGWSVGGIFMPEKECWSLGLPCGYWTALFWLVFVFAVGFAAFFYRDMLSEYASKVPAPDSLKRFFQGPWRIFSGRFNGVEEMEAHLAARGEGGDSILGEGVKEPYQRL